MCGQVVSDLSSLQCFEFVLASCELVEKRRQEFERAEKGEAI